MRLGGRYEFPGLGLGLMDMEIRKNVTAFHLGAEYFMWHKLLRLRVGNGFTSGGVHHISFGAGFNFSPAQIDVAYAIPLKTFNDVSEQFRISVVYRFGAPKFSELYLDRALDLAEDLDRKIAQLEAKQSQLKDDVQNIEQAKRLAEDDWARQNAQHVETQRGLDERLLKAKVRTEEEEEHMRSIEDKVGVAEDKIHRAERISRAESAKRDEGPKTYVVQPGDTLQSIAAKFYKDEGRWKDIFKANADKVDRGRPIPGKTLVIP
jgi:LysM repeat protein